MIWLRLKELRSWDVFYQNEKIIQQKYFLILIYINYIFIDVQSLDERKLNNVF